MSNHAPNSSLPSVTDMRAAVVRTLWNSHITSPLCDSAVETLKKNGVHETDIGVFEVPGAVELTFAASHLIESGLFDVVIVLGCVIKGDTPHFDYVCSSVTQGITHLNSDCDIPVIFGVLTVDNEQQALERIKGGKCGDKGVEAAEAAIRMHHFNVTVRDM